MKEAGLVLLAHCLTPAFACFATGDRRRSYVASTQRMGLTFNPTGP